MILDAVGRDSPAIRGLAVADSGKPPTKEELMLQKMDDAEGMNMRQKFDYYRRKFTSLESSDESEIDAEMDADNSQSMAPSCSSQQQVAANIDKFLQNYENAGNS